tara:strand:- start:2162 stop:3076 length:915 start_codon:yes stop_codon:yes gene_type:complete
MSWHITEQQIDAYLINHLPILEERVEMMDMHLNGSRDWRSRDSRSTISSELIPPLQDAIKRELKAIFPERNIPDVSFQAPSKIERLLTRVIPYHTAVLAMDLASLIPISMLPKEVRAEFKSWLDHRVWGRDISCVQALRTTSNEDALRKKYAHTFQGLDMCTVARSMIHAYAHTMELQPESAALEMDMAMSEAAAFALEPYIIYNMGRIDGFAALRQRYIQILYPQLHYVHNECVAQIGRKSLLTTTPPTGGRVPYRLSLFRKKMMKARSAMVIAEKLVGSPIYTQIAARDFSHFKRNGVYLNE